MQLISAGKIHSRLLAIKLLLYCLRFLEFHLSQDIWTTCSSSSCHYDDVCSIPWGHMQACLAATVYTSHCLSCNFTLDSKVRAATDPDPSRPQLCTPGIAREFMFPRRTVSEKGIWSQQIIMFSISSSKQLVLKALLWAVSQKKSSLFKLDIKRLPFWQWAHRLVFSPSALHSHFSSPLTLEAAIF